MIADIVESVFETMLQTTVHPAPETPEHFESPLTAAVYYAGAWKGALILECSTGQAMRWTSSLMSLAPPISLEDARDGLGEVTNMIAGNLKPLLRSGVGLSIPSVVVGAQDKLRLVGAYRREVLTFADESGPFRIALVEHLDE